MFQGPPPFSIPFGELQGKTKVDVSSKQVSSKCWPEASMGGVGQEEREAEAWDVR